MPRRPLGGGVLDLGGRVLDLDGAVVAKTCQGQPKVQGVQDGHSGDFQAYAHPLQR
jgi:hypothetical protein